MNQKNSHSIDQLYRPALPRSNFSAMLDIGTFDLAKRKLKMIDKLLLPSCGPTPWGWSAWHKGHQWMTFC
jgi:hypothetical protein